MKTDQAWTFKRWAEFAMRFRAVLQDAENLVRDFPDTAGLGWPQMNACFAIYCKLSGAMIASEKAAAKRIGPGSASQAFSRSRSVAWWGGVGKKMSEFNDPTSREDWGAIGDHVKRLRMNIMALASEAQESGAFTLRDLGRFDVAIGALDRAKSKLENLMIRQHRGWEDFVPVFYGPPLREKAS